MTRLTAEQLFGVRGVEPVDACASRPTGSRSCLNRARLERIEAGDPQAAALQRAARTRTSTTAPAVDRSQIGSLPAQRFTVDVEPSGPGWQGYV
ncbi:MAG TPA: hypothetical protein VGO93_13990 [Candidatus Xenobia bacterium]|jgi:hypothetical protein